MRTDQSAMQRLAASLTSTPARRAFSAYNPSRRYPGVVNTWATSGREPCPSFKGQRRKEFRRGRACFPSCSGRQMSLRRTDDYPPERGARPLQATRDPREHPRPPSACQRRPASRPRSVEDSGKGQARVSNSRVHAVPPHGPAFGRSARRLLITEAVRGEGAVLRDEAGERLSVDELARARGGAGPSRLDSASAGALR